jgi:hypothetical protein
VLGWEPLYRGACIALPSSKGTYTMCSGLHTLTLRSTRHRVIAYGVAATDEDSMAKAMCRKEAANLDTKGMDGCSKSFF